MNLSSRIEQSSRVIAPCSATPLNLECSVFPYPKGALVQNVAQDELAVAGGDVEHEPPRCSLALVERYGFKGRVERGRAGDRVPEIVMATHERIAVLPGTVLLVGECVHLHVGAHVQALLRLVELVSGPELHPGDGELEPSGIEFVVDG